MRKGGRGSRDFKKSGYRVNKEVRAPEVMLIADDGAVLGKMSSADAYRIAQDKGLDLIEIAPNAKPPTCKIMDYGRWKYENKKKKVAAKKKQVTVSVKEVQVGVRTEEHDLNTKLNHARRFLLDGDKVKVNLRFRGREMAHQEIGVKILTDIAKRMDDIAILELAPKKEGRQVFIILAPDATLVRDYKKNKKNLDKREAKMDAAADEPAKEATADSEPIKADAATVEAPKEEVKAEEPKAE